MSSFEAGEESQIRMNSIDERLLKLEHSLGQTAVFDLNASGDLLEYQEQLLSKLKNIREVLGSNGGDVVQIKEERDILQLENSKLNKEVQKLNYRINHLIRALNTEEKKNS